MNCALCKAKIEKTFLGKIVGSYVRDTKGKKHSICPQCQKMHPNKAQIIEKL